MIALKTLKPGWCKSSVIFVALAFLSACSNTPNQQINLMPAPVVYGDGMLNPLPETSPFQNIPYKGILYATDRAPATADDPEKHYVNVPGQLLRVGVAKVQLGEGPGDWPQVRRLSLMKSRPRDIPVKLQDIEEWGVLGNTVPFWVDLNLLPEGTTPIDATDRFMNSINEQLAASRKKHVYIYVHGYRVAFENPLLVSAELWHFLGYDGTFIAYSWPSTPNRFAYIKDTDTSEGYSRNLRLLIENIAKHTDVEQIHLLAYSNGTRLTMRAMEQLALARQDRTADENYEELRIHNAMFFSSDLDRGIFGSYVADGLLDVARHMTIYMSEFDKALGFGQFLTRRQRLGQMWGIGKSEISPQVRHALTQHRQRISYINVSPAEGARTGNGHGYFRSSPWASSDMLMSLYYDLTPPQRGLVEQDDLPIYTFPPDYISRLWSAIGEIDPTFAAAYSKSTASPTTDD